MGTSETEADRREESSRGDTIAKPDKVETTEDTERE